MTGTACGAPGRLVSSPAQPSTASAASEAIHSPRGREADPYDERELLERARSYRALCERAIAESKRTAFRPKGFEDLLNHGVYLHNRGEYEEALKALRQAAEIHPKNEHVLYCLAATAARAGDTATAVKALRSAVAASPANRAQARSDSDFDPIREDEEFIEIVYPQAS